MESWNAKCWNARNARMECWNAGMLECQNAGMPECQNARLQKCVLYYSYNKFFDINNKDTTWCSVVRAYRATSTTYHGGIYMGLLPNLKHQKNDRSGDPV